MAKKASISENSRIKQEVKEEREYDPAVHARDRLKGALQDLQTMHSDNSTDSDDYRVKTSSSRKGDKEKTFSKKKKHKLGSAKETPFQHAFVMKLFDRSVDLAQFEEDTPLYPICRAWMANKPRMFINSRTNKEPLKKIKKEDKRDKDKKFKLEDILLKDVYSLPPPLAVECELPSPLLPLPCVKREFELLPENEKNLPTKEVLLASHIAHWNEVKKKIKAEAFKREERFEPSKKILKRIFNGAQ